MAAATVPTPAPLPAFQYSASESPLFPVGSVERAPCSNWQVGMVLDFTRSQQYYQTEEWYPEGHRNDDLFYRKVRWPST